MKINRQLVLRNKNTNKLRRINSVTFYSDCGTYYDIYAHSKSWRSDVRRLRLKKTEWDFVEFKDIETEGGKGMTVKEDKIDCESLMINSSTGTGYWFCKENGSLRVDEEYCKSCLLNKKLVVEIEQGKAAVMARIASRIFKK